MNCSTLRERAAGSPPNTSQVSFMESARTSLVLVNPYPVVALNHKHCLSTPFRTPLRSLFYDNYLGTICSHKNIISHIDASLSRQPLVKGERLVRYEVNAVMFSDKGSLLSIKKQRNGLSLRHPSIRPLRFRTTTKHKQCSVWATSNWYSLNSNRDTKMVRV